MSSRKTRKPARKRYSARESMLIESCKCDTSRVPPQWLLDRIADRALTGGWNARRTCSRCFQALPVTGTCGGCIGL